MPKDQNEDWHLGNYVAKIDTNGKKGETHKWMWILLVNIIIDTMESMLLGEENDM